MPRLRRGWLRAGAGAGRQHFAEQVEQARAGALRVAAVVGQHEADDEALVVVLRHVAGCVARRGAAAARAARRCGGGAAQAPAPCGWSIQPAGLWHSCSNWRASRSPIWRERLLIWLQ